MASIGQDILLAKHHLEKGELVAIPTETVYGLAANALDPKAVAKIFIAKKRPKFDPLIMHVHDEGELKKYVANIPESATKLIKHFWPGPLTLILKKKEIIPDIVTSGLDTVGIRCPDHYLTQQLLSKLTFPIAAPSANPFGYVSPTTAAHVEQQLGDKIAYILDGGPCRIGIESTIVGFDEETPVIYRRGGIPEEAIERIIGTVKLQLHSTSNPLSPGQLESHYSPSKRFVLGDINSLLKQHKGKKLGIIRFKKAVEGEESQSHYLSENGDLAEAAQNLFSVLRLLDTAELDIIIAEKVPDVGIGKAINDRLMRAAAKNQ